VNVHQIVEAVLFASDAPLTADEIARADEMLDEDQVQDALAQLAAEYDDAARAFQVVELAEGYQLLTRPEFDPYLERFDNVPRPSRLSGPSLETLAIIAYRQPIGRLEIEYIRGVGASGVIRTLQDRRLIDVVGRAEGLGRPLLYGTTRHFLEHFGFRSLEDLPRPEELSVVLRERIPLGTEDEMLELTGSGEVEESGDEAASGQSGEPGESREPGDSGQLAALRESGGPLEPDHPEEPFDAGAPDEEATLSARPEGDAHRA
jgi:segregation and condensation protein B